ncbi:hypothetical protein B5M09_013672 [Aphanomyces astaci]|uniref:Uncharacterized protein n=1 Tax=Aphanomyces astaci TaxID=112090 RepID=A0A425DL69_APHAT|nr:hypothetical protein B5M09_013672 [Aphanomyces astaci]
MVEAACLYLWDFSIDGLDESEFHERICKIVGEPANKWTVTKAEMEEQCKKLRVDPFGDVASRVVSFMERVNNIIETRGWKSQLKAPNMLKTFIKAVASCITPFDVRDRVEEQMKTVQVSTLVEISKILAEQLERTYQAELVMKSRGGERKRGRDWDEKGQRTGKTRVQLKNEQYQREAYYQYGNAPRPKGGYTQAELKAKRAVKAMIAEDGREQRWIRLNGVFEVPYCPDTGADQNILPQQILEEMMTLQPDLMMAKLPEAKDEVEAALQDLINEAIDKQFPIENVKGLWRVLTKHDIW